MIPLPELAQHWVRYKAWLRSQGVAIEKEPWGRLSTFDAFMVWLMEDLSNEK